MTVLPLASRIEKTVAGHSELCRIYLDMGENVMSFSLRAVEVKKLHEIETELTDSWEAGWEPE